MPLKTSLGLFLAGLMLVACASTPTTGRRGKHPRRPADPHQIGNGYINGFPPDYVPKAGEAPREPGYERPETPDREPPAYDPSMAYPNQMNEREPPPPSEPPNDCPSCR